MIRLGFAGIGWIGRNRMEAMLATGLVEAAAIVEPSPEMTAAAQAMAPGAALVGSFDELLALEPDGIVIATPSALHADQSIRALEAGCAVFCQKPLGRSGDEAAAVVAAARTANLLLGVDFSYRETTAMAAIRPLVAGGALGHVHAIDLVFHNAYGPDKPWFYDKRAAGGGCVLDLGVHLIDLALWTMGFPEVESVSSHLSRGGMAVGGDEVEDFAVATLRLAGGTVVRLACSWRLHAGQDAVIAAGFYGTQGGAALRNVGGSFYDFTAERHTGTASETLAAPPDAWGGRAAAAWAEKLNGSRHFDPQADELVAVARVVDRIYAGG